MIFYLLFQKEGIRIIDSSQDAELKNYILIEESLSSKLGFYNWIINSGLSLIGINFLLIDKRSEIFKFLSTSLYDNVQVNDREINVLFFKCIDFSMDYSNEFINFNFFKSKDGGIALSFEVPHNFEYQTDYLLDCVNKGSFL